jgi:hypothetical protein
VLVTPSGIALVDRLPIAHGMGPLAPNGLAPAGMERDEGPIRQPKTRSVFIGMQRDSPGRAKRISRPPVRSLRHLPPTIRERAVGQEPRPRPLTPAELHCLALSLDMYGTGRGMPRTPTPKAMAESAYSFRR